MMKYSIDSIDQKFCSKTNKESLQMIKVCQICERIPLPYYINKDSKDVFCQKCYISKNKNTQDLDDPLTDDLLLLGKLVFNCEKFENGCQEEFKLDTIEQLLLHQQNCKKGNLALETKIDEIKKDFEIIVQDALKKQEILFLDKIKNLQEINDSQAKDIEKLEETFINQYNLNKNLQETNESNESQINTQKEAVLNIQNLIKKLQDADESLRLDNNYIKEINKNQQNLNKKLEDSNDF